MKLLETGLKQYVSPQVTLEMLAEIDVLSASSVSSQGSTWDFNPWGGME